MELVVTLLLVGAALMFAEIFLPGVIAGVIGLGFLITGVALGYARFGPQTGTIILVLVIVGLTGGFVLWVKLFPTSRYARLFISHRTIGNIGAERPELMHQSGVAFTQLRPSGTALINGQRVDVVTEGSLVERGAAIKVVAIEGMRVVVRGV